MQDIKTILIDQQPDPDTVIEVVDLEKEKIFEKVAENGEDDETFDAYCRMHVIQGTYSQFKRHPEIVAMKAKLPAEAFAQNGLLHISAKFTEEIIEKIKAEAQGKFQLPEDMKKGELI